MGKIQTILIALDLAVGFLVASTSLQAALTSTAVVSGSTTVVVAADPISYQGRLSDSGSPASGSYDFQFTLTQLLGSLVRSHATPAQDAAWYRHCPRQAV